MASRHRISSFGAAVITAGVFVTGMGGLSYYFWPAAHEGAEQAADSNAAPAPARPTEQTSAALYSENDGVSYALWEGQIIEEMDNRVTGESFRTGFDQNVYNFDLELVLHVTQDSTPQMVRTLFSELSPKGREHIERVRKIGCDIAQEFIKRAADGNTGSAPADAVAFNKRHCEQPSPRPAGP